MVYRKDTIVAPFVDVFERIDDDVKGEHRYLFLYQIAADGEPNFDFEEAWTDGEYNMIDGPTVGKVVAYNHDLETELLEGRKFHEEGK